MKRMSFAMCAFLLCLCCPAQAYVMTFDDVPAGALGPYYTYTYGINIGYLDFQVVDHTGSAWGPPNSGANVLVVAPDSSISRIVVMFKGLAHQYSVYSFGAFFSTQQDTVLQMVGYARGLDEPVSTVCIGAQGQSWSNQYVQVGSPAGNISMIGIYPVSADAFHHFSLDDITVVPVPEPPSLLALLAGLGGLGALLRHRQR